jgi:hypothetical protein
MTQNRRPVGNISHRLAKARGEMSSVATVSGFEDFFEETDLLGILLKSYTEVGSVSSHGVGLGKVTFTAREIVSLDDRNALYDVVIDAERPNQHPSNGSATLRYDEIDRFIAGASRLMRGGRRGVSRMTNFEASIASSDGHFRLVVFNTANGNTSFLVEITGCRVFFSDLNGLSEIAGRLSDAKAEIDRIKIPS